MTSIAIRAVVLAFVFTGCASSEKSPDLADSATNGLPAWVNSPQKGLPENRYLAAVGEGATRNEAIRDAQKNLASSFLVKVQSEITTLRQSSLQQDTTGAVSGDSGQKTDQQLTISTDTFLRGAEVKEFYEGKSASGSGYYVLLALDKLKARSGLLMESQKAKSRLEQLHEILSDQYTGAKWNESKIEFSKLDQLRAEATALGMAALVDSSDLERRFQILEQAERNRMKDMIFVVTLKSAQEYFQHDIEECITQRGGMVYQAGSEGAGSSAKVHQVEVQIVERPQHYAVSGFERIRFNLTAKVSRQSGKMIRIQSSRTETGRSRSSILESASDTLSGELCEKLFQRINEL